MADLMCASKRVSALMGHSFIDDDALFFNPGCPKDIVHAENLLQVIDPKTKLEMKLNYLLYRDGGTTF